jgi:hypothetical protein
MQIWGYNEVKISRLSSKILANLNTFSVGIKISRTPNGIVLSWRKYVLDFLSDTGMFRCQAALTPIDQNRKLCSQLGDPNYKENYQKLVGRFLYLCHRRPDISYAVSTVIRYIHDPRSGDGGWLLGLAIFEGKS